MADRAQLVYTDVPGSLPADYVVPPNLDLDLTSVFAKVNGSAASAAFLPCLTLLSQDGKVIARVRQDDNYGVGDTGDCTWAPFLRPRPITSLVAVVGAQVERDQSTPQSAPSSVSYDTTISWTTEVFDSAGIFDAGTPTRFTATAAGIWLISASAGFVGNSTGDRAASIFHNGTTQIQQVEGRAPSGFFWAGSMTVTQAMAAGDYVDLRVAQNSGGNLNTADCFMSAIVFASA